MIRVCNPNHPYPSLCAMTYVHVCAWMALVSTLLSLALVVAAAATAVVVAVLVVLMI
jgi:hypothetical protein